MQHLILAFALPMHGAHGFLSCGGDFAIAVVGGGQCTRNRVTRVNRPPARPDMGMARDLIR
jgi:hypothetical protein